LIDLRIAAAGAVALAAAACIGPGDFHCTEHNQCTIGTRPGFCEANGQCSVEDNTCPTSLRRYAHRTGDDSDACVPACDANPVNDISAGGGHACLLRAVDHSLWCWGRNDHGQIGDGSRTPRSLPVRVQKIGPVTAAATGDAHTCAVDGTGAVFCWGSDEFGQLGDGSGDDQGFPQQVPGMSGAKALVAGKDFACALAEDGTVRCWGDDSVGQLGDGGAVGPPRGPGLVAGVTQVGSLSASWQHACALGRAGNLFCWGANDQGQIGDGSAGGSRPPTDLTKLTPQALSPTISAVTAGYGHTCAFGGDGLRCWGANDQGQVNADQPGGPVLVPTQPTGVNSGEAIWIAAGARHTCLVRQGEGEVVCWGADDSGQLGGGPETPAIPNALQVAAGAAFTCALASDHALYCWGDNHFGQLAIGGQRFNTTPVQVLGVAHSDALAAGGAHTCATADDANGGRALFCWGANASSQLGNGGSVDAAVATRISSFAPDTIAAGAEHTCAFVAADGQLRCWGAGAAGQLGIAPGPEGVITIPTISDLSPPQGGDGVLAVAAGASHTCVAATISTSVLCFGLDTSGQLGHPPAANATAVAAGDRHSCALDDQGAVWCWGANESGQLGDGIGTDHPERFQVALGDGITSADAIAAGAEHTCALAGGKVLCWGRNAEGQVGTPAQMPILSPTEVDDPSHFSAIAAGGRHTCAIATDATVRCWGANESGQLGSGDTDSRNKPIQVAGLTDVDAVVVGGAHSCARRRDGTVWCWGANTFGQLGDGITLTSPSALLARVACE
jgi:alpha-tubulin suppressor-like RCC1 family protein